MYNYIDESTIFNYLGKENTDLIKELLGLVLSINLVELEELNDLYEKQDFEIIKRRVHKSKPSLSYIGAVKTLEIIHAIEEDLENSAPHNVTLQAHIKSIKTELNSFIQSL